MDYGKLIKQASNQMSKGMDAYAKQYGLTGTQMSIIDFIGDQHACLQRDIEQEFNIKRSTATVALQRMEKTGLVKRVVAQHDARQKEVRLTPKADGLHAMVSGYIAEQQAAMNQVFTPKECDTFTRMLDYFIKLNS